MPYLIFTLGETGAGKTGLITETFKKLGVDTTDEPYVKILVDDLVEQKKSYKNNVKRIFDRIKTNKTNTTGSLGTIENVISELQSPTQQTLKDFEIAYRKARKLIACPMGPSTNKTIEDEVEAIQCNPADKEDSCIELGPNGYPKNCKTDLMLADAVTNKQHIVMETTGKYILSWLLDKKAEFGLRDYKIIMSWIFVNQGNLETRIKKRAIQQIKNFNRSTNSPAVRLPKMPSELCKPISIMKQLYDKYIITGIVDNLLIFSNNERIKQIGNVNQTTSLEDFQYFMTQVNQALGGCDDLTGGKLNRKTIKGNIKHKRTKKSKKV